MNLAPNGKVSNLNPEQYKLVRTNEFKNWFGDWEKLTLTKLHDSGIDEISLKRLEGGVSKVVDENGEPLVVYHSSPKKFTKFKEEGHWFSNKIMKQYGKNVYQCFLKVVNPFEITPLSGWDFTKEKDGGFYDNLPTNINWVVKNSNQIKLADGSNTTFDPKNPDIRFDKGGELRPFKDDGNKLVVFNKYRNYTPYKIAVNDVNDADYITLWITDTDTGKDKKVGYLKMNQTTDVFLSVSEISIDRNIRGLGLALEMYKVALKYSSNKIKGIKSYLPNRSNKKQIPKIYKKLNSVKEGDWDIIYKKNNPEIYFNNGGAVYDRYQYVVDEIKRAIIDLGLPYLDDVDLFNRYYLSKSKTDFGESWYMIFLQQNKPLEIRISDHSVTSTSRILDEKYIAFIDVRNPFKYTTPTDIAKLLDDKFKRLKYIAKKRNEKFDKQQERRDYMNLKLQPFIDKLKSEKKSIGHNYRTYQTLEEIKKKHPDWEYVYHYPNDGAFSFYYVKNDTSGSLFPNFINDKYFDFLNDNGYLDIFEKGGQTISQTPAPKKDQIYGSKKNKPESAKDMESADNIQFSENTLKTIKNKVNEHNKEHPNRKITLAIAKAVVRRGMGAYSVSHRPTIKGGKPNSRVAWGLARLNAFLLKIVNQKSKSGKYIQDDDLINELGYEVEKYDTGGQIKDLIAVHNINENQIIEANRIGGLVTPSIAIIKSGESFTDFGSITLVGDKELINPENNQLKVYAGDVYSPTVPRKMYDVDTKKLNKITNDLINKSYSYDTARTNEIKEVYHLVSNLIGDYSNFEKDLKRYNYQELINEYKDKLKLVYIVDKDIDIKIPLKEKRHFLYGNLEFTLSNEQKKRFASVLKIYTNESNEKGSGNVSGQTLSDVYDLFLEVLENIKKEIQYKYKGFDDVYNIIIQNLEKEFHSRIGDRYSWSGHYEYKLSQAVYGKKELDKDKFEKNINKVFDKFVYLEYRNWLDDFLNQFRGSTYFLQGNTKIPYTLDNLVDSTSSKVVGQEKNLVFGVNQAKSFSSKRLNSIEEIKEKSNILISKSEMNKVDEKNSKDFFALSEQLSYKYRDTWDKLNSLAKALADYFKGSSVNVALSRNDFKSIGEYEKNLFKDFALQLKNSPVDYFEVKFQRAVKISEFKYAIVPKSTSKEAIDILTKNGLKVKKYTNDNERNEILIQISNKDKSIKFEDGGQAVINQKNTIDMKQNNEKNIVSMNVPLFIRICEFMREDVENDADLHFIVENILNIKNKDFLTMSDYENIININVNNELKESGGRVESIHYKDGEINLQLEDYCYDSDSDVELVPISELIKFREFDRKKNPKYNKDDSQENINHLKYMFKKDGVKSPLIIEYNYEDGCVLLVEGNHRLNSAIDLEMMYLPAKVHLRKSGRYSEGKKKNAMPVIGVKPDEYGYIPSNLKPSQVGIEGTVSLYREGGIIEGRLHSECGEDGCGRKFEVGDGGRVIEAERDEAVIVADAFEDNSKYTIEGTPSEIASALNVLGGGKNFDKGAEIIKDGESLEIPEMKKEAVNKDVDDVIDSGSIIINRRSMYDKYEYKVTGTPKQIASAINSLDGNGVVIEEGAKIEEK